MSDQSTGRNRLSRLAAKEVPHRQDGRLFAAKSAVTTLIENLTTTVRRANLHEAARNDLLGALQRAEHVLHDITPATSGATGAVKELAKQVDHLQLAEKWIAGSSRVLERLGANGSKNVRDRLEELQESVLWCVRATHWDGELTTAVKQLQHATQEAEAQAARATA
jgi:chromosome segregation ATPase